MNWIVVLQNSGRARRLVLGTLVLAVLLGAWQVVGDRALVPFVVPFSDALRGAIELVTGDRLTIDVLPSVGRALGGFLLGSLVGYVAGTALGVAPLVEHWTRPAVEFARLTPVPILIPIVFEVFGADNGTRIGLIALAVAWPVMLNAIDGTRAVDTHFVDSARIVGFSRWACIRRIYVPAALPQVFAGMRIGLGLGIVMMVVSEMVSADSGLGQFVLRSQRSFALMDMYSGVLVLAVMGGLFTLGFNLVERRVLAWYHEQKGMIND